MAFPGGGRRQMADLKISHYILAAGSCGGLCCWNFFGLERDGDVLVDGLALVVVFGVGLAIGAGQGL